jgi:hypothetical protein
MTLTQDMDAHITLNLATPYLDGQILLEKFNTQSKHSWTLTICGMRIAHETIQLAAHVVFEQKKFCKRVFTNHIGRISLS